MPTPETVVKDYMRAWNETNEDERRSLLDKAWADDATYTDPTAHVEGRNALVAHIGGMHAAMPGVSLKLTSATEEHHGRLRFAWAMNGADGALMTEGIDIGLLADDGRLASITGFFGPPPPLS